MSTALMSSATHGAVRQEPIRVMVVDDSVVIRGMISRWIDAEPDMKVAASLRTGLDAVNQLERINPDVAVLDIEMRCPGCSPRSATSSSSWPRR
jgi:two-component system chemotaxis response regulator CheB